MLKSCASLLSTLGQAATRAPPGRPFASGLSVDRERFADIRTYHGAASGDPIARVSRARVMGQFSRPRFGAAPAFHRLARILRQAEFAARHFRIGVASWRKRAKEMPLAYLDDRPQTARSALPAACWPTEISTRAQGTQVTPSTIVWLLRTRVEHAMILLRRRENSLSEIAVACDFLDQSHFKRVFARHTGMSPGAWRRADIDAMAAGSMGGHLD